MGRRKMQCGDDRLGPCVSDLQGVPFPRVEGANDMGVMPEQWETGRWSDCEVKLRMT